MWSGTEFKQQENKLAFPLPFDNERHVVLCSCLLNQAGCASVK